MEDVVIVAAAHAALGKFGGTLGKISASDKRTRSRSDRRPDGGKPGHYWS